MNTLIECTPSQLSAICAEADQTPPYFGVAANMGLSFAGGFDHFEIAQNRWSVTLHDRGMNDRCRNFIFRVPVACRNGGKQGPAK